MIHSLLCLFIRYFLFYYLVLNVFWVYVMFKNGFKREGKANQMIYKSIFQFLLCYLFLLSQISSMVHTCSRTRYSANFVGLMNIPSQTLKKNVFNSSTEHNRFQDSGFLDFVSHNLPFKIIILKKKN